MPLSRAQIVSILFVFITFEWVFDLTYRWINLHEKLHERPDIWKLLRSSLTEAVITIAIVFISLKIMKEGLRFFREPARSPWKSLGEGAAGGAVIFSVSTFVISPWLRSLNLFEPTPSALPELFQDLQWIPIWIFLAVFSGGFIEELQRIFTLRIFEENFGKAGLLAAVLLSTLVFGFGHLYQGANSAINIGLTGLAYSMIYLRTRDPIAPMTAHAVFDLIGVALGFALLRPS